MQALAALGLVLGILLAQPSGAGAALVIVCGPPKPDGKECCPVALDHYLKYPANPRTREERHEQAQLAEWINQNCANTNRRRR